MRGAESARRPPGACEIVSLFSAVGVGLSSVLAKAVERQRVLGQDEQADFRDGATQGSAMKSAEIAVLLGVGEGVRDLPLPIRPCA